MPELPEVEIVAKALHTALAGRTVAGAAFISRMRRPFDPAEAKRLLCGRRILNARRRAKYIIIECEGDVGLLAHLGMTGAFRLAPKSEPRGRHDRAAIRLDQGDELRYADARRFGFVVPAVLAGPGGVPEELAHLGPEPLERGFCGAAMSARAQKRAKTPVKVFLMDQEVVVGIGNIYASEALFLAGVDPRRPAASLDRDEWDNVAKAAKKVLRQSIRRGGSSIRNYRGLGGEEGKFQLSLKVYGKAGEPCPVCGGPVETLRQGGRSTFLCPRCQG